MSLKTEPFDSLFFISGDTKKSHQTSKKLGLCEPAVWCWLVGCKYWGTMISGDCVLY